MIMLWLNTPYQMNGFFVVAYGTQFCLIANERHHHNLANICD